MPFKQQSVKAADGMSTLMDDVVAGAEGLGHDSGKVGDQLRAIAASPGRLISGIAS
jgi:hypothetical protein